MKQAIAGSDVSNHVSSKLANGDGRNGSPENTRRRWAVLRWSITRGPRRSVYLLAAGHTALFAAVYWAAFLLRFDFSVPPEQVWLFQATLTWILGLKLLVFYLTGHFHGWWRYVTFADLLSLLRAAVASLALISATNHFLSTLYVPRVVLLLDCALTILLVGVLRASWRLLQEQFWPLFKQQGCSRALLVGADDSGGLLAHQIQANPLLPYRIVGFLDTDASKKGSRLGGIRIFGNPECVVEAALASRAKDILVTAGSLSGGRLRLLIERCDQVGLQLRIVPPVSELLNGNRHFPVRNVDINDLLQREAVQLDAEAIGKLLNGATVLVTGAGGSIGSEICRQVIKFEPRQLVLVERFENSLFMIDSELRAQESSSEVTACLADVTDEARMRRVLHKHRPQVVFHAAAHKHVPLLESHIGEAIKNNVLGTKLVCDLSSEFGVSHFVLASTDKAVNPASVMGVSKRLAESYVQAMSEESGTRFVVVRFGNVLGSNGSVVPTFQAQIRRGGPVTVTHPEMERFFMTISEASQLVLQAAAMGRGGEIFVLEMGMPVKIVDLARDLIRLSGLPADAIEIAFTGLRPGEKLFEELYLADEQIMPTAHPKVHSAYPRPTSLSAIRQSILSLVELLGKPDEVIRQKLQDVVPDYRIQRAEVLQDSSECLTNSLDHQRVVQASTA